MKNKVMKKSYRYFKNIAVSFEWINLCEVTWDEQGMEQHYNSADWLPVSIVFEIEAEILEPTVLEQLDALDKMEADKRRKVMVALENELSMIKDRRASLLCLTNQPTEE